MSHLRRAIALLGLVALVAASCNDTPSDTGGPSSASPSVMSEIGEGEGALSLVAWPGYTENSWVKPFEKESGCKVSVTPGNTSDEMVNLMRQSGGTEFDGVSASGDAPGSLLRLAGRQVRHAVDGDVHREIVAWIGSQRERFADNMQWR